MQGDQSAYAALGLRPGAHRDEVDQAYRRLIKVHHPDLNGGDGARAAEINRAYTQLRREVAAHPARRSVPMPVNQRRRRGGGVGWLAVLVVAIGVAAVAGEQGLADRAATPRIVSADLASDTAVSAIAPLAPVGAFDEPLHGDVIDAAIRQASTFHALGNGEAAIVYSRDCHNRFRSDPNLAWFDACAAFDESTLTLAGTGAASNSGPFSGSAVMARELAAARAVSRDVLGAESRLQQIRLRVELTLVPTLDPAAAHSTP